jgi:heme-degrading monooxygenase HmoA
VIRSVLYLRPRDARHEEIVDFYRRHGVLDRAAAQDGCLGAELQLPTSGRGEVLVTALWRDAAASRGWLDNPARAQNADELGRLIEEFDPRVSGQTHEVLLDAEPTP